MIVSARRVARSERSKCRSLTCAMTVTGRPSGRVRPRRGSAPARSSPTLPAPPLPEPNSSHPTGDRLRPADLRPGGPLDETSRLIGLSGPAVTEAVYRKQVRLVIQTGATATDEIFGAAPSPWSPSETPRRRKSRCRFPLHRLSPGLTLSGWRDLNPRPLRPERSALPSCATPRSPPCSSCCLGDIDYFSGPSAGDEIRFSRGGDGPRTGGGQAFGVRVRRVASGGQAKRTGV